MRIKRRTFLLVGMAAIILPSRKVIPITNQDFAGLDEHAGHTVHLSGEMAAGSVTVSKIEMPASGK